MNKGTYRNILSDSLLWTSVGPLWINGIERDLPLFEPLTIMAIELLEPKLVKK